MQVERHDEDRTESISNQIVNTNKFKPMMMKAPRLQA
jgi:hypothetical protein